MIVMKFGGSSVDGAESIARVVGIVRGQSHRQPVVVVSAMAKTTRKLWNAADAAAAGEDFSARFEELREYHLREAPAAAHGVLESYFSELRDVLDEIAAGGRVTPRLADHVASFGELISSTILSFALESPWIDCRRVMITDGDFTRARPIYDETEPRMRDALLPHLEEGRIPVLGGFVGSTVDGVTTTLGAEGSDFSAAVVGAGIQAEEIQIWTDVDGMLTADPRIVPGGKTRRNLSFAEAPELACSAPRSRTGALSDRRAGRMSRSASSTPASAGGDADRPADSSPGIKSIACKRKITIVTSLHAHADGTRIPAPRSSKSSTATRPR